MVITGDGEATVLVSDREVVAAASVIRAYLAREPVGVCDPPRVGELRAWFSVLLGVVVAMHEGVVEPGRAGLDKYLADWQEYCRTGQ